MNKSSGSEFSGENDRSLEIRAAWLAYVGGHTQEQVAQRLGVSRVKAHRLLAAAGTHGIVQFSVEGAPTGCLTLEEKLCQAFALAQCTVIPSVDAQGSGEGEIRSLGLACARHLARELESAQHRTVGVGHGRTLAATVESLPRLQLPQTRFVSLLGSLTRRSAANPYDVISALAQRTGSECYFLPVPFFADSTEDAAVLRTQRGVSEVMSMAHTSELCVIGIGDLEPGTHLVRGGTVTEDERRALCTQGAAGELVGRFVDGEGHLLKGAMNSRAVGVELNDLRGKKVLAVAGGLRKARAIRASLKTGVVSALVVDEETAKEVLRPKRAAR